MRLVMSLGVASRFAPLQWRSNSNSSRCVATAATTDFAAAFPLSRVEAARMERTMTDRVHVPRLRPKAELNGDVVLARLLQQVVEFAERLHGKRAGRFQEHFEDVRPLAQTRGSACHVFFIRSSPRSPGLYPARPRSGMELQTIVELGSRAYPPGALSRPDTDLGWKEASDVDRGSLRQSRGNRDLGTRRVVQSSR